MITRKAIAKYRNVGLLILRIGLGIMFILHGYPKLFGGPEMWEQVGSATQAIDVSTLPVVLGFLAAVTEFFGGICLILGIFFRPALGFLIILMIVAASTHISAGDSFAITSHSIEMAIVFVSLLFLGPGKHTLAKRVKRRRRLY